MNKLMISTTASTVLGSNNHTSTWRDVAISRYSFQASRNIITTRVPEWRPGSTIQSTDLGSGGKAISRAEKLRRHDQSTSVPSLRQVSSSGPDLQTTSR